MTDLRRTSWTKEELHAEAARRGAEQRRKQGLPPTITDPVLLRLVDQALATRPSVANPARPDHGPAAVDEGRAGLGAVGDPGSDSGMRRRGGEAARRRTADRSNNDTRATARTVTLEDNAG